MRVVEKIQHWIYVFLRKDTNEMQGAKREIPYTNKPITEESVDEIGMGVYVEHLESAIESGADTIAVVSDFGTGKSSLIELLKEKYHGWTKRGKERCDRIYCQVNLWSQLANGKEETLELHRAFLYQLISTVYPHKSSYFSRRTGRNFGIFKISAESPWWSVCINLAVIVLVITANVHYFSESIIASGLISEATIGLIILLGYLFCGIVVILLLVKTEIIFSAKDTGDRQIEENELIDLYREHILSPRHWYSPFWNLLFGTKHIVVVIEDLDRTEDGEMVYHFLKELRKYYVPNEQLEKNYNNYISFIVNIMPEDMLHNLCQNPQESKYVYNKIFDYTMNLNRINIDNFDVVLEGLLQEKREELSGLGIKIGESVKVHQIPGMRWIILGKQLSLRQVKERLNDAILLYESLVQKFGVESVEFPKCAAVAYLRSAFLKEFYHLSDRKLEEMITWYAKAHCTEEEFLAKYAQEESLNDEFIKVLYQMIEAHLIDGNYRSYFFNYPKSSNLYSIQETRVSNLIVYNEELTEELQLDIGSVAQSKPKVIIEAMQKCIELVGQLPKTVLFSIELWNIAALNYKEQLLSLVAKTFSNIKELTAERYKWLDSVIEMQDSSEMLCQTIKENRSDVIIDIRNYIIDKHRGHLLEFIALFNLESVPLSKEELNKLEGISLDYILDMIAGTVAQLEDEVMDIIGERISKESNTDILIKAENYYSELVDLHTIDSIINDLISYTRVRGKLITKIEDVIYEAIEKKEVEMEGYFALIDCVPISEIGEVQIKRIVALEVPGRVSEEICNKMKSQGEYRSYLLNMAIIAPNRIDVPWETFQNVMNDYGKTMWEKYRELFVVIRYWACKTYKDKMVQIADVFMSPYPIISKDEMEHMSIPAIVFEVYDVERAEEDGGAAFIEFCNRQFRKGPIAFAMFRFVAEMERKIIPEVFYKLDMRKVRFALMSKENKLKTIDFLRMPLKLNSSEEIIRFMDYTECLVPELEQELTIDLKESGNGNLCKAYIKAVQKYGKVTRETIKNLVAMPSIYPYGDMLNEELYKRKYYRKYVCSKTQEAGEFEIEYEKLEVLWGVYLEIFKKSKTYSKTCPLMYQNKAFLKMVQNRGAYTELPEESRMAMATIAQDENTLRDVLNYSDEFVLEYFSSIIGFTSKTAAEAFVSIMEEHQKYAQNSDVYNNVYQKLEDTQLKSRYTRLYHKANS